MTKFVHLKTHSEYSLIDSTININSILKKCEIKNFVALALTDMTNLCGALKFFTASIRMGIKPIFGIDLYINTKNSMDIITLIAKNNNGYKNIVEIIYFLYTTSNNYYNGIPTLDVNLLDKLIVNDVFIILGNQYGILSKNIFLENFNQSSRIINFYLKKFPKDNIFIEIQRFKRINEDNYLNFIIDFSITQKIPLIATNDVRFIDVEDYYAHEVKVGIFDKYNINNRKIKSLYNKHQYLKSSEEMCKLFSDIPQSLSNTVYIAKNSNVTFEVGSTFLPNFTTTNNLNVESYFIQQTNTGLNLRLKKLYLDEKSKKQYFDRLNFEINVIKKMKYYSYFLIVSDFVSWAKENNIPVGVGRGSGAGSLVAYSLNITDIDPIKFGLLFERFLNPDRISMPDLDIDFCIDGRDKVIEYIVNKYGNKNVAQIVAYSTLSAKAVVRDVGRVLGNNYIFVDKIAKMIPNNLGIKLKTACEKGSYLYNFVLENKEAKKIIDISLKLEGLIRGMSKHAAGIVISPSKIIDFSPVYCDKNYHIITQFDKSDIENIGLVKFDLLGLKNLTIINNCIKTIKKNKSIDIDIKDINIDNIETFNLLKKGNTIGIFQLESFGMTKLVKRLLPDSFEDIVALIALYRPGPIGSGMVENFINCKHGIQKIYYLHPSLENILKETYGVILYQEQVMYIAQNMANYSLSNADLLRRVMGKKIVSDVEKHRKMFKIGAQENKIDDSISEKVFNLISKFANYGFNKSHSVAYAMITYQTAYLKANYTAEFMSSCLSSDIDHIDKISLIIFECKRLNINITVPNVNESQYKFCVNAKNEIIYGLGAIKGIGKSIIYDLIQERQKNGKFLNIENFFDRIDLTKITKKLCLTLLYAGALDVFNLSRAQINFVLDNLIKSAQIKYQEHNNKQMTFFSAEAITLKKDDFIHYDIRKFLILEKKCLRIILI